MAKGKKRKPQTTALAVTNKPTGTALTKWNALKDGVYAVSRVLVRGDDADGFKAMRAALYEHYSPVDPVEIELVEDLAWVMLRLRRIQRHERALCEKNRHELKTIVRDGAMRGLDVKGFDSEHVADRTCTILGPSSDRVMKQEIGLVRRRDKLVKQLDERLQERSGKRPGKAGPQFVVVVNGNGFDKTELAKAKTVKMLPALPGIKPCDPN